MKKGVLIDQAGCLAINIKPDSNGYQVLVATGLKHALL